VERVLSEDGKAIPPQELERATANASSTSRNTRKLARSGADEGEENATASGGGASVRKTSTTSIYFDAAWSAAKRSKGTTRSCSR
jgi:hypothetical protein